MDTSNYTANSPSSYIYIIQAQSGAVKIGVSNDPRARLKEIQGMNHEPLRLICTLGEFNPEIAYQLETMLHQRYAAYDIHHEWFSIGADRLMDDIRFVIALSRLVRLTTYEEVVSQEMREKEPLSSSELKIKNKKLYRHVVVYVGREHKASVAMLKNHFHIDTEYAQQILAQLEAHGIIAPDEQNGNAREVYPVENWGDGA